MSHATEGELHAHLDGALSAIDPAAADRLMAHLDRCVDCRTRLEEERSIRVRAGELLDVALPGVAAPPFEMLAGGEGRRRPGGLTPRRLAWAASVVVALGAGWMGNALLRGEGDVAPLEAPKSEALRDNAGREDARSEPDADWRDVSLEEAERWVAARALRVPDLEIIGVEAATMAGHRVIRLRQALPEGISLELLQEAESTTEAMEREALAEDVPADAFAEGRFAAKVARATSTSRVRIQGLWLTASAPLASDSLRALVSRIR